MRRGLVVAIGGLLVLGGVLAFQVARSWSMAADLRAGQALYATNCGSCHGVELQGQPNWQTPLGDGRMPAPPHDEGGHTWHHPDSDLHTIVKFGMGGLVADYDSAMPAFAATLSDREIELVLSFIKSNWPARERQYQVDRTRERELR